MYLANLGHTFRIEDTGNNKLRFDFIENGQLIPYYTGTAVTVLPRVLAGEAIQTSGGLEASRSAERGDLKVILNFSDVILAYGAKAEAQAEAEALREKQRAAGEEPTAQARDIRDLEDIVPTSEPPRSRQEILNYLAGGLGELAAGRTEITQFAQSEAWSYGTGFISRALEDRFNFEAFRFGGTGSEDNPFYVDVEKDVSDDLTLTYYRDFFNQTIQSEEFGMRYKLLKSELQNLDLTVNFAEGGLTGPEREFMFEWTVRLGKKPKPKKEEPAEPPPSS